MRRVWGWLSWFCLLVACGAPLAAAGPASAISPAEMRRKLAAAASISWSQVPLRRALDALGQAQHLTIVLDRRVDPTRSVTLGGSPEPLANLLARIAESVDCGYSQLGSVAYIGPRDSARRLRTVAAARLDDARRLPKTAARKFLLQKSWQWDEASEPAQLLESLAGEADVQLAGLKQVPHDLWPAADLPPLSWVDRLTLVAVQFDLTFQVDAAGTKVTLRPLPEKVTVARDYRAGREAKTLAQNWSREMPEARIKLAGQKLHVDAPLEVHEVIEQRLKGKSLDAPAVTHGPQQYQLTVEKASLEKVVGQLAERLQLEFVWDRPAIKAAGLSTDQLVSVQVDKVQLDALLRAVFDGTGLAFERRGQVVEVKPGPKPPAR
jgi:hypothetical protein